MNIRHLVRPFLCAGLVIVGGCHAGSDASCSRYTWDVAKEKALFRMAPTVVTASSEMSNAPLVNLGHLYDVQLQQKPELGRLPGDTPRAPSYAGIVSIQIPASGIYWVSMDKNAWVNMTSGITAEVPTAYQAAPDCKDPYKVVQFRLEGVKRYVVQLAVIPTTTMRLSITPAPAEMR